MLDANVLKVQRTQNFNEVHFKTNRKIQRIE